MAIEVKHGANPGAVLQAAFGAGQARDRAKVGRAHLKAQEAKAAQERQIAEQQRSQLQAQGFKAAMQQDSQSFRRGLYEAQVDDGRMRMLDEHGLRHDDFEFTLTAQQKADQEKYRNSLYALEQDDSFTAEEKEEGRRRLTAKFAGIKPLPRRKDKENPWGDDKPPSFRDFATMYSQAMKDLTVPSSDPDAPPTPPTSEVLEQHLSDMMALYQTRILGQGAEQPQQQAAPAQDWGGSLVNRTANAIGSLINRGAGALANRGRDVLAQGPQKVSSLSVPEPEPERASGKRLQLSSSGADEAFAKLNAAHKRWKSALNTRTEAYAPTGKRPEALSVTGREADMNIAALKSSAKLSKKLEADLDDATLEMNRARTEVEKALAWQKLSMLMKRFTRAAVEKDPQNHHGYYDQRTPVAK